MLQKRNLIFLSLLILGVLLLTSCFLKPPVTEGILKGQVLVPEGSIQAKDLTGQALADATANIIDPVTGDIIATTTTDANGYYQVFVPAGGPYLLEAIKDGIKVQQFTPPVEAGIEYELGTADCSTTAVALIAQAMLDAEDYPDDLADINLTDIETDPNFDDVMNIVCSAIEAGGDPTESALVQQAVEDLLHPPTPTPTPTPTPPPAVINIAAIPGVTAPVTGETPVTAITATAQYTGTVTWTGTPVTFAGATVYTATITLTAKPGFTLTGVAENFFTVAGTSSPATNAADLGLVTAEFPETAAVVIDIAVIAGVTVPATGATPVTTITETAQYTGIVTWYPAEDPFQGHKIYVATITLTAKAGFTLTGVAANYFTVVGAIIVTNTTDSGVVTAVFPESLEVGDSYGGGKVAYILQPGESNGVYYYDATVQHGLIAAIDDQSTGIQWITGGYTQTTLLGITSTEIGKGQANTNAMMTQTGYTGGAAKVCLDYSGGGYNDWFLPSKNELNKLCINRDAIGGFVRYYYWSSSEYNASNAWYQNFSNGNQFSGNKGAYARVRAVRAF